MRQERVSEPHAGVLLAGGDDEEMGSIVWINPLVSGEGALPFGFSVEPLLLGDLDMVAYFLDDEQVFQTEEAKSLVAEPKIILLLPILRGYSPPS